MKQAIMASVSERRCRFLPVHAATMFRARPKHRAGPARARRHPPFLCRLLFHWIMTTHLERRTDMTAISIGVIGAGLIGRKHLKTIAAHPDFDLAGIADVNADAAAAQNPGARIFADYRKLLDDAKPDAVIIASPNQAHAEMGI